MREHTGLTPPPGWGEMMTGFGIQGQKIMIHRHLNHQDLSLAAIDDVIARGKRRDWEDLRLAILANPVLLEEIQQVCRGRIANPYAQRYHFWMSYATEHLENRVREKTITVSKK
jgi:hypothetical protein